VRRQSSLAPAVPGAVAFAVALGCYSCREFAFDSAQIAASKFLPFTNDPRLATDIRRRQNFLVTSTFSAARMPPYRFLQEQIMASNIATADGLSEPAGLSQGARVVDTFIAPTKTFSDILRSQSWWLPFLLIVLASLAGTFTVQQQVGFARVTANQMHANPKQEEALSKLPPEQRDRSMAISAKVTAGITYAMPLILLLITAFYTLILWGSFNFLLGSSTTFSQVFAVNIYAMLPYLVVTLLMITSLYLGGNAEAYDYKYPVGTSLGYFLPDVAPWLRSLLGRFDLIQLWSLGLTVVGMAIIAKKSIMQSAMVVVGWWILVTLIGVAGAAFTG
jgi:hypothetical protein